MTNLVVKRVNALPGTLEPSTFYIVKSAVAGLAELHFTTEDGTAVRHVLTSAEIDAKIAAAVSGISGGGTTFYPNTATRYEACTSPNYKVHCLTFAPVHTGLSWSRTGTDLTVTHNDHGRSVGDRVITKNVNVLVLNSLITAVTANTYTVTCADLGDVSGAAAHYTPAMRFAHNSEVAGALTGGTMTAPAGVDIVLSSMRIHTPANSRAGLTYDLVLPVTAWNSVIGPNLTKDEIYIPVQQIRAETDPLTAVGNTIAMNQSGAGYATLKFGALGATAQGQLMLLNF